jgi:hypothetical protein
MRDAAGEPYLFDVSSRYTASPEKNEEIRGAKKKAERVVTAHPLPENMFIEHEGEGMDAQGELPDKHVTTLRYKTGLGTGSAGYVEWNPRSGHIHLMSMRPEYRAAFTSHLLNAAHEWANKEGVDGPAHSDIMSDFAYKMAKRHAPQNIPEDSYAGGAPVKYRGTDFLSHLHGLRSRTLELEAQTQKADPSYIPSPAVGHLDAAIRSHQNEQFSEINSHINQAVRHIGNSAVHAIAVPHPHSSELADKWFELQSDSIHSM